MATSNLTDRVRDEIGGELRNLATALGERAVQAVTDRVTDATGRLSEYAKQGGDPGLVAAATGAQRLAGGASPVTAMFHAGVAGGKEKLMAAFGRKGGRDGGKTLKVTNIVEAVEVGVPVRVAYNQWTTFGDFPSFMKKVEQADCDADEKMTWKAQVLWSHRTWESTIVRQIPDRLIHWRSKGEKGSVDGTVSFHEVGPDLTRILVVLEYHPQGFFEHTGNLWRAQGRRVRLELKHFVRHVMTRTVLDPDAVEGWRGEIEDSQVVKDHETALREERGDSGPSDDEYAAYDEGNDFDDDEYAGEPVRTEPERARSRTAGGQREPERRRRVPQRPRRPATRRRDER
ncbi:SRPBCC family protein [Micromonospora sp. ANENR4]|uniref:SRPBCC family protein n=1 Tax=unclassified Micromonospora TaxID=2617518 RepID=UPI00188E48EE|nr:SRPBCC family protein [Micromonospora sp. WMMC273]MBF5032109.1 SRPBCC family protein [Micromonospora sp. ANENR4]MCZ7477918.1 SRPBCC family protein [Micromonospora sp. WMMC273]